MNDELNKQPQQSVSNQNNQQPAEKEKTPYELYLEEKAEREKIQKQLNEKDKKYQINLINLEKKVSGLENAIEKKDNEIEITKAKYWSDKESDYKEAIHRRQNTEEGIIVSGIYEYLDNRVKDTEYLKKQNIFYI